MVELQQTPFDPTASATALTELQRRQSPVPTGRQHRANAYITWSDITPEIEEHLKLSMARFANGLANTQIPVMTQRAVRLFDKALQFFAIQANTASKWKKHDGSQGSEGMSKAHTINVTLTLGFRWLEYVDDCDDCDDCDAIVESDQLNDDCVPDIFNMEESDDGNQEQDAMKTTDQGLMDRLKPVFLAIKQFHKDMEYVQLLGGNVLGLKLSYQQDE
jgi:hypothetical protein